MASVIEKFDDEDREAALQLLENYWIIRDKTPEVYQLIRRREQALRSYFADKCGFQLIVNRQFIKLEKIPAKPAGWMGFTALQQPRDYALLCCLLAFLEEKNIDEQFLLSDLCESLLAIYPQDEQTGEPKISWESYECRKSLVRVLTMACEYRFVTRVDGDIAGFMNNADSETLFEVPLMSRYLLRSYPKDLCQYSTLEELLASEYADDNELTGRVRKHRVYRELYLTPGYERCEAKEDDFLYLRNMRNRLREDLEDHSLFKFELYKDVAMLTVPGDRRFQLTAFPDRSGISGVMLHFAAVVRNYRPADMSVTGQELTFTPVEFDRLVAKCRKSTGSGWTKEYRDMTLPRLTKELLAALVDWKMARLNPELGLIVLSPLLGRTIGVYPSDYNPEKKSGETTETSDEQHE